MVYRLQNEMNFKTTCVKYSMGKVNMYYNVWMPKYLVYAMEIFRESWMNYLM